MGLTLAKLGKGLAKFVAVTVGVSASAGVAGLAAAGLLLPSVNIAAIGTTAGEDLFEALPEELELVPLAQSSYIYTANGKLLATFYFQDRTEVPLDMVSLPMQHALVALEDKRFYDHVGVDWEGMARAAVNNAAGQEVQGASTLTQQYIKNLLINKALSQDNPTAAIEAGEKSYQRKIREAKLAISLEKRLGKDQILEGYLNIAQFGPSQYGVESAARYYFGVHASDLTPVQAATVAAIAQSPNGMDPVAHPRANQTRRDAALKTMLQEGYITLDSYIEAVSLDVEDTLNITPSPTGCALAHKLNGAAFFCEYVVSAIRYSPEFGQTQRERDNLLRRGGLRIRTTLDLDTQAQALEALTETIPQNDESGVAMALTAVEPGTGKIIAMAQNREYGRPTDTNPRATTVNYNVDKAYGGSSGFQAGSTFKPFTLAAWLKADHTLREAFDGSRRQYNNTLWKARCLDGGVHKQVTWSVSGAGGTAINAVSATAASSNGAYAAMEFQLDLCDITELTKSMGLERADGDEWRTTPSMVFGTNEITPLAMAGAYATFASGGIYCQPVAITKVTDATGVELEVPSGDCKRVLDQDVAAGVSYALREVIRGGTGTSARIWDGRDQAGKTGTTDAHVAVWFAGYTAQLAAAVWAGHPEGNIPMTNLRINDVWLGTPWGGTLTARTWGRFMNNAMEGLEHLPFPEPPAPMLRGKPANVPGVVGLTLTAAGQKLSGSGFTLQVGEEIFSDLPAGTIVSQSPQAGSQVYLEPGQSTVTIVVSKGAEPPPPPTTPPPTATPPTTTPPPTATPPPPTATPPPPPTTPPPTTTPPPSTPAAPARP